MSAHEGVMEAEARDEVSAVPLYGPLEAEARWQAAWRSAGLFAMPAADPSRSDAYVLAEVDSAVGGTGLDKARTCAIADAHARFRRARREGVLFALDTDAPDGQLERLGLSVDWARAPASSDATLHRWTQSAFLALLDADLIHSRDGRWWLRSGAYHEESERRLSELADWSGGAVDAQRSRLGRVDGVEFDASTADGVGVVVFTPRADAIAQAAGVVLSPNHPEVDRWTGTAEARQALDELSASGTSAVVDTGMVLHVPGLARVLPVAISPMVDARFGATAALVIPDVDDADKALAQTLPERRGNAWRLHETLRVRPATRRRAPEVAVSGPEASGAPIPVVRCEKCGLLPISRKDFVEGECPSCNSSARRDVGTLDGSLRKVCREAMWAVPPEDRIRASLDHPELGCRLPVTLLVTSVGAAAAVLERRAVAKALRDTGVWGFLTKGEPYAAAVVHGHVELGDYDVVEDPSAGADLDALLDRVSADTLRFALLYAAAPARTLRLDTGTVAHCEAFLARLWAFAEPRLREVGKPASSAEIRANDRLRRRLAGWRETAIQKTTENFEHLDLHRATRNAMILLERIEDFEYRVLWCRGELADEDREASVAALVTLVQLVAPIVPHLAEEMWQRAGCDGFVGEARWPVRARPQRSSRPAGDAA